MRHQIIQLASDPQYVPFVYDYCDMWCASCPAQSRCLAYAVEQLCSDAPGSVGDTADPVGDGLAFARAVAAAAGPEQSPIADLDVRLADPYTAPRAPAIGHPLELLARHYAVQSAAFLRSCGYSWTPPYAPDQPLAVLTWFHVMIAAKTYRALVSAFLAESGKTALEDDARGAAKIALIGIDRSLGALYQLRGVEAAASGDPCLEIDAQVGALIELLEALKTAMETRFPDARHFLRPGLDVPWSAAGRLVC